MKIPIFEMERMQSAWENIVELDLSESGVLPVTLRELVAMGFDLDAAMDLPLGYSQTNGTPELRKLLAQIYPGATGDHIEVTNGTSEANYLLALSVLRDGDQFALEVPNYMQFWGLPKSLGATVRTFRLQPGDHWEPDWTEFERAAGDGARLVYVSNPNNPTGSVLSENAMQRIVDGCERAGAYLVADEVYLGAEISRPRTKSFWGMSDRVIVTSGLSKAYGIPGLRIGWIVGPPDVIADCWSQHDYTTICPNKLSDLMAQTAIKNRGALYDRTRAILTRNLPIVRDWVAGFGGALHFREPEAGALCLIQYDHQIPSAELCERIRVKQNTLIVPGSQLGLEASIRVWLGGKPEVLREGLRRVGAELKLVEKTYEAAG
jgi:aspartate/methionine/tyrosine aminotransferase